MSGMDRAVLPESIRYQCPTCGEPVAGTLVSIQDLAVMLEACGHVIPFSVLNDSWGLMTNELMMGYHLR